MKKRILGLDTGTNSLGWAVVDKLPNGQFELIKKGSLVFQEGVKIEKGIEKSKASERTQHRSLRKQYFRRRLRKIEVLKVLIKHKLCPYLSDEQLHEWHAHKKYPLSQAFLDWQKTNETEDKNPYYYRYRCLLTDLDINSSSDRFVLGRALYHLAQRRGFISNRLDSSEDNNEAGKVKAGISELSSEIEDNGCNYLGEYFYKLYKEHGNAVRLRTRYTDREEHYIKEFYAICEKQHLESSLVSELEKALYFQRPLKSQKHNVGRCTFEPMRPRCADSHPAYEEFRMWSLINNIKVQGPGDEHLRHLYKSEKEKILPKFYRKTKDFDFEVIAKELAGKNNYQYIKDEGDKEWKFNYRMSQSVSSNTTSAALREIWGDDYRTAIAETYSLMQKKDGTTKSVEEAVDDIWNALTFFETKEKLKDFAINKLQLSEDQAEKFSKIKLSHSYSSLSLCAIRKILPYLKRGLKYSHAVFMANVPTIVGREIWADDKDYIESNVLDIMRSFDNEVRQVRPRGVKKENGAVLEELIKDFLSNNYDLNSGAIHRLYHPSMIDVYQDAKKKDGIFQLGSPRTDAIRNPMAMRSLHELRRVINQLLKDGIIDNRTEVHIEYARELNDANKRKAISDWNKGRERRRKTYAEEIKKLYQEACGLTIEPTETDILKFELWEEQSHICIYTGRTIGIVDFLGENPQFDIEHTIPQSVGGDSSMMNLTLCESKFNRIDKGAKIPTELANHEEILARLEGWRKRVFAIRKELDTKYRTHSGMEKSVKDSIIQKRHLRRMDYDYWRGKVDRFTMTEVPEGFSLRQGIGIGLISKYAGLYLKSLFHNPEDRSQNNIRVVKGLTTAEFRKMWGIQGIYEQKSRDNHVHHCIDAITIACMDAEAYNKMAHYYHEEELHSWGRGQKPSFPKPWPTFTEDMNNLANEVLVAHETPDNMPKQSKYKEVNTPTGRYAAQGDTVRGSLHLDTFYGAIEKEGEIKYVVRRQLSSFEKESEIMTIVDDAVRKKVLNTVAEKGFKLAISEPIYMNESKGILIKKVRCYANTVKNPLTIRMQRDLSKKEYKREFHVMNDGNYIIGIYEGVVSNKTKRSFEILNRLEASNYYKRSSSQEGTILPGIKEGLPLLYTLKIGTRVLFYEKHPDEILFDSKKDLNKRLYKMTGLSISRVDVYQYGLMTFRHCQEARSAGDIKAKKGVFRQGEPYRPVIEMNHNQIHALVEGVHFKMNCLGEIELI